MAIDTDNEFLFVVYEFSPIIQIIDAGTMTSAGTTTMPQSGSPYSAGIVYDNVNKKLYAVQRNSNTLFSFDWDAATKTLTLEGTYNLHSGTQAYGLRPGTGRDHRGSVCGGIFHISLLL